MSSQTFQILIIFVLTSTLIFFFLQLAVGIY